MNYSESNSLSAGSQPIGVLRKICITILLLLMSSGSVASKSEPLCVLSPAAMPESWRPRGEAQQGLSRPELWSQKEADDAEHAVKQGLHEIVGLFFKRPSAIMDIWDESVAAMLEVTYSSANKQNFDTVARYFAERNLGILIDPYVKAGVKSSKCNEFVKLLPLAIYAHRFYGANDPRTVTLVALTNASYRDCGSFTNAIDFDYKNRFSEKKLSPDKAFDLVLWSLYLIEAELYPDIQLPAESREFSPALWNFLETYRLPGASEFKNGAWNEEFRVVAYLATHIAFIPTGNHRYPIYIEDSPNLYRFHRENFYPVLQMGELDLVAEFVDSLRQYGCTAENDQQVRDGTRYLLKTFHQGKDRWMVYRERGQTNEDVSDYDLVHKAWTGMLGVRVRNIEPPKPGTYGGIVRNWLPTPPYAK